MKFEKVEVVKEEGIFNGWLKSSNDHYYNPRLNDIYVEKKSIEIKKNHKINCPNGCNNKDIMCKGCVNGFYFDTDNQEDDFR